MNQRKISCFLENVVTYFILAIAVVAVLLPFSVVFSTSFRETTSVFAYPPEWIPKAPTLINYVTLLTRYSFARWFLNSVVMVALIVILKTFFDSLAGYAFSRGSFKGKEAIFRLLLSTMMIPFTITLIPAFLIVDELHLIDTYWGLILPALANPIGIFMMRQFFASIPSELLDAARVDGCNELGVYLRIALPISTPAVLALATYVFVISWTSFLWPLVVIQSEEMKVLAVAIPSLRGLWQTNWGMVSAASTLAIVPVVILFIFTHRYFVSGIRLGALKG